MSALEPCRCGHPGAGCTCYAARLAELERNRRSADAFQTALEPAVAAGEPLDGPERDTETPEAAEERSAGAEPVEPEPDPSVFSRADAGKVMALLVSGRGREPADTWSEAEQQAEKRLYAYLAGRIDGEHTEPEPAEPAPLDPTPAIVAAVIEAFPHEEPCTFPDRDCHCGAAETRRRVAELIADLRLTRAPEPTICRYGHTEADHEAAGACQRPLKVRRPHWLPAEVWMGVIVGQWPIKTFPSQGAAERWADAAKWEPDQQAHEQRRIWRVEIPADTPTFKVETVPASTRLIEAPW